MSTGANANPRCQRVGNGSVVRAPTHVSDLLRNKFPLRAVPRPRPGNRVGNLVQQHLMNFVIIEASRKVARDRDPLRAVVAHPGPRFG